MADPRGAPARDPWFGPTVLVGLAGAGLTAVAGSRVWATGTGDAAGIRVQAAVTGSDSAPLVVALGLVALAAWGAVLVLRGRPRRLVALMGAAAALGSLAAVAEAFSTVQDDVVREVVRQGATGDAFASALTGWYYLSGGAAAVALGSFVVAVVRAPRWPTMGAKYDAPGSSRPAPARDEDMWRALDEGRDPTS